MNMMMSMWIVLGVLVVLTFRSVDAQIGSISRSTNTAPESALSEAYTHVDSGNSMYSAYGFLKCTSDQIHAPGATEEVSGIVKKLASEGSSVKVRATRHGYHSPAGFGCPGRRASTKAAAEEKEAVDDSESSTTSVTLVLHRMNRVVSVDKERSWLTVESGMTCQNLVDAAEENGMTVPLSALPIYGNLTLSGVIATSAHGSGVHPKSSLGSLVRGVRWVNGKGEILLSDVDTESGQEEIAALVGGMGLLGIITEFSFQLDPGLSFTMGETRNGLDDAHIAADVTKIMDDETPFVIVHWRPDFGNYRIVLYTPLKAGETPPASAPPLHPKARGAFMSPIVDHIAGFAKETLSGWENDPLESSPTADVFNAGVHTLSNALMGVSFFVDEADGTLLDNVTLPTNRAMLAAECSPKCVTETRHMGAALKDVEFTLKLSQLEEFVSDMKAIVKSEMGEIQDALDVRHGKGKLTALLPPGFFWLRFGGKSDSTLLSTNAGDEDVVYIQWVSLESASAVPEIHQKIESVMQTYEQLVLCKYKARPHWGKNYERVFRHPKCHVRENYPERNFAQMLHMQQQHDPKKMFEPELFSHVLAKSGPSYYPRCASALWCYCEEDVHCPTGNVCRPSPVFPEYKICKLDTTTPHLLHDEL